MAVVARTWVPLEGNTAAKMNTIRDDILELQNLAGFNNAQYGTITVPTSTNSADATVSTMSARAILHNLGAGRSDTSTAVGYRLSKVNATTIRATMLGTVGADTVVGFVIEDPKG